MTKVDIDIDDVLYPWYDRAHQVCERAGISNGISPTTWYPYEEYGCAREDWLDALADATINGYLFLYGDPIPGAVEALRDMEREDVSIHLITTRGYLPHGNVIKIQTIEWLNKHRVPHSSLHFTESKGDVRVDYFLDDVAKNVQAQLDVGGRAYLLDRPWNQTDDELERVYTVDQFADRVFDSISRGEGFN